MKYLLAALVLAVLIILVVTLAPQLIRATMQEDSMRSDWEGKPPRTRHLQMTTDETEDGVWFFLDFYHMNPGMALSRRDMETMQHEMQDAWEAHQRIQDALSTNEHGTHN